MSSVTMPDIAAGVKDASDQEKHDDNGCNGKPLRRWGNAFLTFGGSSGQMFGAGRVVFAEERLFIEAQIARDGAHEPVAKNAAGQLRPIFIFQSLDKTSAEARGLGQFIHGNFAQLALALQAFTKISPGHEPEPVLDDPSATAKRSIIGATARRSTASATAKRLTRRALAKKRLGIPRRHYRQGIRCCQTERKWEIDERGRVPWQRGTQRTEPTEGTYGGGASSDWTRSGRRGGMQG